MNTQMVADSEDFPKDADWLKIEYAQIHDYGRTIYQTIQSLAQLTFVINPALAAGFYYLYFEKKKFIVETAGPYGLVAIAFVVAGLGVVFNLGAHQVYAGSHECLEALLVRMRAIDKHVGIKTHKLIDATAPRSYRSYWGPDVSVSIINADRLTRIFLSFLAVAWLAALIAVVWVKPKL